GVGDPARDRVHFWPVEHGLEVMDGVSQQVRVEHDIKNSAIVVHGAAADLQDLAPELRNWFLASSAAFIEGETIVQMNAAHEAIRRVVAEVLRRHEWLGATVKQRLTDERFRV